MNDKKIKILAIDDNRDNLITIKALMGEIYPDARVLTAISGKEGIEICFAENPDVILLDIVMPVMDGFEVCTKLKEDHLLADIPVIFLTANKDDKSTRIRALEVGAEAFLAKPIDESELLAQIRAMLKIRTANLEKRNENVRLKALIDERTQDLKRTYSATLNLLEDLKAEIEARKETEEKLRESEEKYRFMTENTSDIIWHMDKDFRFDYISNAIYRMQGFTPDELIGKSVWSILKPEHQEQVQKIIKDSMSGKRERSTQMQFEFESLRKDGSWIWSEVSVSIHLDNNGQVTGYHGVTRDITERKMSEEKLRESEEKYRLLVENSPNGIAIYQDNKFVYVNKTGLNIFGASKPDDFIGKRVTSIVHPDSLNVVLSRMSMVSQGNQVPPVEEKLIRFDGTPFIAEVTALMTTFNGQPAGQVLVSDITERKMAAQKLVESEEKFRDMADMLPQVIFEITIDSHITYVNQQAKAVFGYEAEEFIGCDLEMLFSKNELERAKRNMLLKFDGISEGNKEYRMKRRDGTEFPALIYTNIIYRENIPIGLRGVLIDITEQKETEAKIIESESKYYSLYTLIRLMSDTMPDMLWAKDLNGSFIFTNKSICENLLHAVDTNEPIGKNDLYFAERSKAIHPEDPDWNNFGLSCLDSDKLTIQGMKRMQFYEYGTVHGKFIYLDVHKAPLFNENNELIGTVGTARDITEKKHAEEKLMYVTRLYALLSQINQAVVRTKTVEELLTKVCHLAIEFGQFRMAWFGYFNPESNSIEPAASAGYVNGYLDNLHIQLNTPPFGNGPTGRSLTENRLVACNDIETDPIMQTWKKSALKRGYKSLIAAPIKRKGIAFGTMTFYANEVNFFDEEEQKLIAEVMDDISYAIDAMDSEQERKATEKALIESEAKYREFVENSPEAIAIYSDGIVSYVNKECLRMMRATSREQLIGLPVAEFIHPDNRQSMMEKINQITLGRTDISTPAMEEKYIRLDGTSIIVEVKVMPMTLDGKPAIQLTARDISDRKMVEKALERSRMELKTIYDYAPVMMCVVDSERRIQFANKAFTALTGLNQTLLKGGVVGSVIGCIKSTDESHECGLGTKCRNCVLRRALEDTYNTGRGHQNIEFQSMMRTGNVSRKAYLLGSTALIPTTDQKTILLCFHEITDRKLAEEALQKSETLLRTFIDNSPFEIWARDNQNVGILENKKLVNHYGSIIGSTPKSDNRIDRFTSRRWEKLNERVFKGETVDDEYEFKVGDEVRSFQQIIFPIKSNLKIIGIAGFNIDITERKKAEDALSESQIQLKKFAAHLQNVREEERVLLAREIHDELGQILIAIKIDMGMLKQNVVKNINKKHSEEVLEKFDNLVALVNNTIKTARKIITDLRPEVLELLGFSEAVKLHMKNFQERYRIECNYINSIKYLNLDSQQSVALFRIIQEAMNNVAKHAHATKINVELNRHERDLSLQISDNGVGFDENQKKNSDSYGLIGMRERVFLLDGELTIDSKPGNGTRIKIKMPYTEASSSNGADQQKESVF